MIVIQFTQFTDEKTRKKMFSMLLYKAAIVVQTPILFVCVFFSWNLGLAVPLYRVADPILWLKVSQVGSESVFQLDTDLDFFMVDGGLGLFQPGKTRSVTLIFIGPKFYEKKTW